MSNSGYKNSNTLWQTIKRKLEIDIINGKYKSAEKVPSITEMAELYDIGQSTAKKVLENMFQEGTITKQRGVGYFVKPFMKDKLKEKHMKVLEDGINRYVYIANELGVSGDALQSLIDNKIKEIYSR